MSAKPPFKPRYLLNPFYLLRRLREMRSARELGWAVANVFVLLWGLAKSAFYALRGAANLASSRLLNGFYDARGLPRLIACRAENAYYALRGLPRLISSRSAKAYYKADLKALFRAHPAPPAAPARTEPASSRPPEDAGPASPAIEDRDPASLLHSGLARREKELAERFRTAQPFRHVVIDDLLDPAFCAALAAEFPPYEPAVFRNDRGDLGKAHHEKVSELSPSFRKLDQLIQTPAFLRLVSAITGIPDLLYDPEYFGGGTHENLEEMELDPHVDFTIHPNNGLYRRVNLLLYLNPEWDESWGGSLELHVNPWLRPDQNKIRTVSPVFNRCVLFETSNHSWHGFRPIRLPPEKKGVSRRSFALYLYTREKPPGFAVIPSDLTVFVDRPFPEELRAGVTLGDQDARVLRHLFVRRDWKLRYLYGRAIHLYNDWSSSEEKLKQAQAALKRAEEEKTALANDLRLSQSQLRESLEALLRSGSPR